MINPVKGSGLAEQIELARRSIEEWPQWLRNTSQTDCSADHEHRSEEQEGDGKNALRPSV